MSIALYGIAISSGIAIGRVRLMRQNMDDITQQLLETGEQVAAEIERFEVAVKATRKQLEQMRSQIPEDSPVELGAFLSLHIMLLADTTLSREPCDLITSERCNAEWALKLQTDKLISKFQAIEDGYLRERQFDVLQVVERIFKNLSGNEESEVNLGTDLVDDTVLVAHDLSPADMLYFRENRIAAFVTDVGGPTSHTAILGRSMDMPSVIALHHARSLIDEDELVIVDGQQGVLIVSPEDSILVEYRKRQRVWRETQRKLNTSTKRKVNAQTQDGVDITLLANIERPEDAAQVRDTGALGIGLFRSEFMFMDKALPSEDEQFEAYRDVITTMKGLPVIARTMDLGADKNARWQDQSTAANPALGLTGIRLSLFEPALFRTQLRALLRASVSGPLKIMFPMVGSLMELRQAIAQVEWAKEELKDKKQTFDENISIGSMIETPGAALIVGTLLKQIDFVSIGTNDLIQYTLAVDRNDNAVSNLYDPTHPAVLKLLTHIIKMAGRMNKDVSICGEMAGDPQFTRLLMGMGLRKFSMHPNNIMRVKQAIVGTNLDQMTTDILKLLRLEDPVKISYLLDSINYQSE